MRERRHFGIDGGSPAVKSELRCCGKPALAVISLRPDSDRAPVLLEAATGSLWAAVETATGDLVGCDGHCRRDLRHAACDFHSEAMTTWPDQPATSEAGSNSNSLPR